MTAWRGVARLAARVAGGRGTFRRRAMISARTNVPEFRGIRAINVATRELNTSLERLATGKRINRASDDPSGLIAADSFAARGAEIRSEIKRLERAVYIGNARDGAQSAVGDLLIELEGLVVQAANTGATSREEREALQIEVDGVLRGMEFVISTSQFNGIKLFEGQTLRSLGGLNAEGDAQDYTLADLGTGGRLNLIDGDLEKAQQLVGRSREGNNFERADLGARIKNDFEARIDGLYVELENLLSAESVIRDTDYAVEVSNLVRAQVLREAATQSTLIARAQQAQATLALLGGANILASK
jgi:flagellin